ncbi:uncharacterized protein RHOBADRAFT_54744 [Rhodotorula graminis WP1]|uniref:Proteasome assembly chaperone 2 n=1 Tax=Rhodotorula graminis (strain WP1) TaxID=578459 RepID=A0A0P9EJ44_RHOGW|nr:uncharacterized protein RHOBADRAFT_54744 [Rhodotorula graminis WP1]KPV73528.1 hypothetical protein RHOBADRAFT_54744 [Rhodotorula graminis WP1]
MDYFVPVPGTAMPSFASSTLLLPQPSLSSVAQLACDLLVHNCALKLVGYLGVRDFVPAVGARDALPGSEGEVEGLSLGTEVYTNPSRTLTLVLPRTPVIHARKAHHLDAMARFVAAGGFRDVLVVAGVDAAMRGDEALNAPTPLWHLIPSSSSSTSSPLLASLQSLAPPYSASSTSSSTTLPSLPHAGLTRSLLAALSPPPSSSSSSASTQPQPQVPTAALLAYTAEGTAAPLAHLVATALAHVLGLPLPAGAPAPAQQGEAGLEEGDDEGTTWVEPVSWERGLMGVELERDGGGREMFS